MDDRILKMTGARYGLMPNEYGVYYFKFLRNRFDDIPALIERPDAPGVLWSVDRNAPIIPRNDEIEPVTAIDGKVYRALHLMNDGTYELFESVELAWKTSAMLNAGMDSRRHTDPFRVEYERQRKLTRKHLTQASAGMDRVLELGRVKVDDIRESVMAASLAKDDAPPEEVVEIKNAYGTLKNADRIRKSAVNAEPVGRRLGLPRIGNRYAIMLTDALPPGVADPLLYERDEYPGLLWAVACDPSAPERMLPDMEMLKEGSYSVKLNGKKYELNVLESSYEIVENKTE